MANAESIKMPDKHRAQKAQYQARADANLIVRKFTDVPMEVVEYITRASATYGSRSRALQVGIAAVVLSDKPESLMYKAKENTPYTAVSYRLLPQTMGLITRYTPVFGSRGEVIAACYVALRKLDDKMQAAIVDMKSRVRKMEHDLTELRLAQVSLKGNGREARGKKI